MTARDWASFAQAPLTLPIGGKSYVIPPMGAKNGALVRDTIDGVDESMKDTPTTDLWKMALGPSYQAMVKDDVPDAALEFAARVALHEFLTGSREMALEMWNKGPNPEAPAAPKRAAKGSSQRPTKRAQTTRTGAARTTPRAASGTGTTSPLAQTATPSTRR